MTLAQITARVEADKKQNPERYCPKPHCLWVLQGGPCPDHPAKPAQVQRTQKSQVGVA